MKKILLQTMFFILTIRASSQTSYKQAAGIKFPGGLSFTYKKFITDKNSLEAQLTTWNKGLRVSGLYEFNFHSFSTISGLAWFAGPGAHVGFWKDKFEKSYNSKVDIGIDGIIGLDYKFNQLPVNVSVDWQPSVTLAGNAGFTPVYGGIAVRYTF